MQTSTAAVQRRAVDVFLQEESVRQLALVTSVSDAEAGATRLKFRWFSAKRSEKKAERAENSRRQRTADR